MTDLFCFNRDLEAALARAAGEKSLVPAKPQPTPDDVRNALAALQAGNATFVEQSEGGASGGKFPDLDKAWRENVALNHHAMNDTPLAAVLCCSDHRASPELIFWQGLGRLFVIRDAGNLLDDHGIASLEYAIEVLQVPLIVVLAHEGCGAVVTAIKTFQDNAPLFGTKLPDLIERFRTTWNTRPGGNPTDDKWLSDASLARTRSDIEQIPIVKARLGAGNLRVVTARYHLLSGVVSWGDPPPPA